MNDLQCCFWQWRLHGTVGNYVDYNKITIVREDKLYIISHFFFPLIVFGLQYLNLSPHQEHQNHLEENQIQVAMLTVNISLLVILMYKLKTEKLDFFFKAIWR